jgi:hypothetical protein
VSVKYQKVNTPLALKAKITNENSEPGLVDNEKLIIVGCI